jgi:hypothetical protein
LLRYPVPSGIAPYGLQDYKAIETIHIWGSAYDSILSSAHFLDFGALDIASSSNRHGHLHNIFSTSLSYLVVSEASDLRVDGLFLKKREEQ